MTDPQREKRQIVQDCLHDRHTSADAILNALHQGGWAIIPKDEIERLRADLACERDVLILAQRQRDHATQWAQYLAWLIELRECGDSLTEGGILRAVADAREAGYDPQVASERYVQTAIGPTKEPPR